MNASLRSAALWPSLLSLGFGGGAVDAAVVISKKPTQNMTCSAGVCSPTGQDAILNVTDLANMLAASNVKVIADGSARDIVVAAALSWASNNLLTLDSYRSIAFEKPMAVAGSGGLAIVVDDGGVDGDFTFGKKGHVEFWDTSSELTINGVTYALASGVHDLASAVAANPSGNYALASNYDAANDGTYQSAPIPTPVHGTIEGLGNILANLKINDKSENLNTATGLVGSNFGTIRDIRLTDIDAKGGFEGVLGGLAGENRGKIVNSHASGVVSGGTIAELTGGIAGVNYDTISGSDFSGAVSAVGHQGGLVGENYHGTISSSHASGKVTGLNHRLGGDPVVGGLVGLNDNGLISQSYATNSVTGKHTNTSIGGLIGQNGGTVTLSFATGAVSNVSDFGGQEGGLVGQNTGAIDRSFATGPVTGITVSAGGGIAGRSGLAIITDSYSTGSVYLGATIGGFVGDSGQEYPTTIERSYSIGLVHGSSHYIGGFVGGYQPNTTASDDYWDLDTSGISDPTHGCGDLPNCPGVTGLTTAQFQSALPTGFSKQVWGEDPGINNGFPYLLANPPRK